MASAARSRLRLLVVGIALLLATAGTASAAVSGTATEAVGAAERLGSCTATAPGQTTCSFWADAGWGPAGVTGGVLGATGDGFTGSVEIVAYDHITSTPYWTYRCTILENVATCHWVPGYGLTWGPFVKGRVLVEATADGAGTWTAYLDDLSVVDALG